MKKKIFLLSLVFILVVSSGMVYAEESSKLNKFGVDNLFKAKQNELKESMKQNRLEEREEMKNEIKSARQEFQQKLEIKREENRETLIKNREDLKLKLQTIKDENKQSAILNINDNISKINERATNRLSNLINTIEEILGRIENRMNTLSEQGLDISLLEDSVNEAKMKIIEAKNSTEIQAGKIYNIEITDESNLREEIKNIRDTLQNDLKNLQNKVKEAHSYTKISAQKLVEIVNIQDDKEGDKNIENSDISSEEN
ncbi:MAG: hypothetical protein PHT84_01345 [Candidatus Pacebacteria bacterium]|nr:hypothetical protein [Candidatus Paceibacterota bacterium]